MDFNSGMFEFFKEGCKKFYMNTKGISNQDTVDASGWIEGTKYKTGTYTINLYFTTSRALVNGKGLQQFIASDMKTILADVDPVEAARINDTILHTCIYFFTPF